MVAVTYTANPIDTEWLAQLSAPPGALHPILDAEIVAINDVPVLPVRIIPRPLESPAEPHRLNPWYNPEPWLLAAKFSIPLGITGCIIWGFVDLIGAITAHAADITRTAEYAGLGVLGLIVTMVLLRGGKGGCPGLHCGGCRG
jgi:hypothetical protein